MPLLPIKPHLPDIRAALESAPNLALEAPPGAGKTTLVPLALLDAGWTAGRKIIVLEPRRLAARAAAHRMAALRGEAVGESVGYRVRLDRRIGAATRIECVTTGLFLRQLQSDPELPGVAAVLFDEFHERAIDGDLALAFCLEAQAGLRPDLRLVVMSATMDAAAVASLLPGARTVRSEGRGFPVETLHLGDDPAKRIEDRVTGAVLAAINAEADGDLLVFLPGTAEIRRAQASLSARLDESSSVILPLHGDLPLAEQDKALGPDRQGRRKIVLATSIAETSLTIEGIRVVIDSGLRRAPRFDPGSGMTRLITTKISLAAADQRRGRAGRTAPGTCYRLWSPAAERALALQAPPEILAVDLAPLALELAAWGVADPAALALLDPPPEAALSQAQALLRQLGALDPSHRITPHGQAMAELGVHPRLAHMILTAKQRGLGSLGCDIAALLSERDLLKGRPADIDLRHRIDLLHGRERGEIDRHVRDRVMRAAEDWRRQIGVKRDADPHRTATGQIVALAYPDRLAQRRNGIGQFRLSGGGGAILPATDPLAASDFLAVASLDGDKREARVFLAAPISQAEIEEDFAGAIEPRAFVAWNSRQEAVEARQLRRLWALVLDEKPLAKPAPEDVLAAMLAGIREMGLGCLPWTAESETLRARIAFLRSLGESRWIWPDLSDAMLAETLETWLAPYLAGCTRRAHLASIDLKAALLASLDWAQRQALDELAPTHLTVPSGSHLPLTYLDQPVPVLAVRLQEMFGATETPRIAGGRVQVLLHLLSPARRPVQITRDLAGFWANSYRAVKADLKGQYPKHHWPDDPLMATPTARAKPRGT